MKKYKKTYAILNLSEKHTIFHLGKTKVHVSFTGGIVTKKGVTPATFTTDNPVIQLAIENSEKFKKGEVTLLTKYPMQGEVKIGKNEPEPPATEQPKSAAELIRQVAPQPEPVAPLPPMPEQAKAEATEEVAAEATEGAEAENALAAETEESAATDGENDPEAEAQEEAKDETGLTVVEVSCKDVAKQYLQEHFDEKPAPLRTIADVQECAAKYGIKFNFV